MRGLCDASIKYIESHTVYHPLCCCAPCTCSFGAKQITLIPECEYELLFISSSSDIRCSTITLFGKLFIHFSCLCTTLYLRLSLPSFLLVSFYSGMYRVHIRWCRYRLTRIRELRRPLGAHTVSIIDTIITARKCIRYRIPPIMCCEQDVESYAC